MTWELRLLDLFDDLEQQAEGLSLQARDGEVSDLARSEYAEVDLAARLHASLGGRVRLGTATGRIQGRLLRVGKGWCLVDDGGQEVVVALPAVLTVEGVAGRSDPEQVRPVSARLGLGSVLRAVVEDGYHVAVWDVAGQVHRGFPTRVGADFLELSAPESAGTALIPFAAVAWVRRR